jgi:ubiquinone/menaquinone biosynthesis C-methylase UbiE
MGIDYHAIYREQAEAYDRLVTAEDRNGNILVALQSLSQLHGARVLEVGVGTGRITRLLAPLVARLHGCDDSRAMLAVARRHLRLRHADRITLSLADVRALPVRDGWAELAVAGWVFGHFTEWTEATWRDEIGHALDATERAVGPGGTIVILETMGTGTADPGPPTAALAAYYRWLEWERGFSRSIIRTDYEFRSLSEAVSCIRSFVGAEIAALVKQRRVPEWTGVWSKRGTGSVSGPDGFA